MSDGNAELESIPALAPSPKSQLRLHTAVAELVFEAHLRNSTRPIDPTDEHGAFPDLGILGWGAQGAGVPPVVVDANAFRNDVIRACRTGRTVLVSAANSGAIRVFAAGHVIDEMDRHAKRWAEESGDVSEASFRECWESEYLPLLRVIEDRWLSVEMLGSAERGRIADLEVADNDDVPSAILALALGAFFLSTDADALLAVYAVEMDLELQKKWADRIKPGGDAAELGKLVFLFASLPSLVGTLAFEGAKRLTKAVGSPLPLAAIALALALAMRARVPAETLKKAGRGAGRALVAFSELYEWQWRAFEEFRQAAPSVPSWGQLASEVGDGFLLRRAALHTLARSPSSNLSAVELAARLPELAVARGEQKVREALRESGCFFEPYRGRWQVGKAVGR